MIVEMESSKNDTYSSERAVEVRSARYHLWEWEKSDLEKQKSDLEKKKTNSAILCSTSVMEILIVCVGVFVCVVCVWCVCVCCIVASVCHNEVCDRSAYAVREQKPRGNSGARQGKGRTRKQGSRSWAAGAGLADTT